MLRQFFQPRSFLEAWKGAITVGASAVIATQQSRTFTGAVNLTRPIPEDATLPPRSRSILNLSGSDGFLLEPGSPRLKTEIFHGDAERDQYLLRSHVFAFGKVALDHNFSQGLNLQQDYGAGIGWTAVQNANETFDLKASMNYVRQRFRIPSQSQSLVATDLTQDYKRKFGGGVTILEQLSIIPSWNNLQAWQAAANSALTMPVYGRLAFTISGVDSFLNDPAPGFRKNSFQMTMGLTYTLQ